MLTLNPECFPFLGPVKAHKEYSEFDGKSFLSFNPCINAIAYSSDSKIFAEGTNTGSIKLWDTKTLQLIKKIKGTNHSSAVFALTWSFDNQTLISGLRSGPQGWETGGGAIEFWNCSTCQLATTLKEERASTEYHHEIGLLVHSSDDPKILISIRIIDKQSITLSYWNTTTNTLLSTVRYTSESFIGSFAFSSDQVLAISSQDGKIRFWNTKSRTLLGMVDDEKNTHWLEHLQCAYSPTGSKLASACPKGIVKIWDTETYKLIGQIDHKDASAKGDHVNKLIFLPNGRVLVTARNQSIKLWDVDTQTLLTTLFIPPSSKEPGSISVLACSLDGCSLTAGTWDSTITTWDLRALNIVYNSAITYLASTDIYSKISKENLAKIDKIDLNKIDLLEPRQFHMLLHVLPLLSNLASLKLTNCGLTDERVLGLRKVIALHNKKITNLDLSGNSITYEGALYLSDKIREMPQLHTLNLANNRITCPREHFSDLSSNFFKSPSLELIKIEHNFIEKECKVFFENRDKLGIHRYNQYQTTLQDSPSVQSVLSPKETVTRENWVVAFVCHKSNEHAMLYLEGMKKWGQRIFQIYDIRTDRIVRKGIAHAEIRSIDFKKFNPEKYFINAKSIERVQGKRLIKLITDQKDEDIPFSKTLFMSAEGKVNCIKWCLDQLARIDIHMNVSGLGLPSQAAAHGEFV